MDIPFNVGDAVQFHFPIDEHTSLSQSVAHGMQGRIVALFANLAVVEASHVKTMVLTENLRKIPALPANFTYKPHPYVRSESVMV